MKNRYLVGLIAFGALAVAAYSQSQDAIVLKLTGGEKKKIALPDFRATGAAGALVEAFNKTVFEDIQQSGLFDMAAKSFYPLNPPQQEADLRAGQATCAGRCLSDWAGTPVSAGYLGFGYAAEQGGQFVAFGHLYNTAVADIAGAKVFRKLYNAPLSEEGARKAGHEYAADILAQFGAASLVGSKIYFVSDRTGRGNKEIWVMDFDGSNQSRVTSFNSITTMPAISPDGRR